MNKHNLYELLEAWGLTFFSLDLSKPCFGSPERSLERIVVSDAKGASHILEQIHPQQKERRMRIAENLHQLNHHHPALKIVPYCLTEEKNFVHLFGQQYWMLAPYRFAQPLDRPKYLDDDWRGALMAQFLIELHRASIQLELAEAEDDLPALDSYILSLVETIGKFRPELASLLKNSVAHLTEHLFPHLPHMENVFSHGDFHPLNILWGSDDILGVIDWEFSGRRPVLYDLANMLSCLGMEHPHVLRKAISQKMLDAIQAEGFVSKLAWSKLYELMLAVRFAWLSEWLRKNDEEMVELEVSYMNLLLTWCKDCN